MQAAEQLYTMTICDAYFPRSLAAPTEACLPGMEDLTMKLADSLTPSVSTHLTLNDLITGEALDRAVDRAAKHTSGTVSLFAAAPAGESDQPFIELAMEFFVPPTSLAKM